MKRNLVIFVFLLAVVSAMIIFGRVHEQKTVAAVQAGEAEATLDLVGKPAPDFTLKTLDDKDFKLSDLRGKAVLLNFWATWCTPCKAEMPWFVDFQRDMGAQGLQVVGVAMDDAGKDEIAAFAKKMGVNYPIAIGKEATARAYGGIETIPETYVLDRNGVVLYKISGIIDRKEVESKVKMAIAGAQPNTVPQGTQPKRSEGAQY